MYSIRFIKCCERLAVRTFASALNSSSPPSAIIRQIYPYSNVKIVSNFHLKIKPYDVLDSAGANTLRVSLQPSTAEISSKISNLIDNFNASIEIDDQNVVIDTKEGVGKQLNELELNNSLVCVIELPPKANLKVVSERDVGIENMYSDEMNVVTGGHISTKNIQSINLSLTSEDGDIRCSGSTLAHKFDVRTNGDRVSNV